MGLASALRPALAGGNVEDLQVSRLTSNEVDHTLLISSCSLSRRLTHKDRVSPGSAGHCVRGDVANLSDLALRRFSQRFALLRQPVLAFTSSWVGRHDVYWRLCGMGVSR